MSKRKQWTPQEVMDVANELPPGQAVALDFSTQVDAEQFRFRLYSERSRVRASSRTMLPGDDPLWGKSPWEGLVFVLQGTTLYVRRASKKDGPKRVRVGVKV